MFFGVVQFFLGVDKIYKSFISLKKDALAKFLHSVKSATIVSNYFFIFEGKIILYETNFNSFGDGGFSAAGRLQECAGRTFRNGCYYVKDERQGVHRRGGEP